MYLLVANAGFAQNTQEDLARHAQAAKAAEARRDFPTAIREYQVLVKALPQSAELRTNLGIALYLHNSTKESVAQLRKATELAPHLFAPHLFLGLCWYRLSQPDPAVAALSRAVEINGADSNARLWLGYALTAQSRQDLAVEHFQIASKLQPTNIDALYALGTAYLELGRRETKKLLAAAPDGGRAWQLAAEQWVVRGDKAKALKFYEEALKRRPDLAELKIAIQEMGGTPAGEPIVDRGVSHDEDQYYLQARQYENLARTTFESLSHIAPNSYRAHQILADALAAQERKEEAITEYQAVLNLNPTLPGIHQAIGMQLLRLARPAEALKEFEAELKLQPQSAIVHLELARACLSIANEAANEARAFKLLHSALELDRPPTEIFKLLGKIRVRQKEYVEAAQLLERYIKAAPEDSSAHYLLSRAYRGLGKEDAAQRELALYRKSSLDAKQRNAARRTLEMFNQPSQLPVDDTAEDERL